jgi:hypothetical protein
VPTDPGICEDRYTGPTGIEWVCVAAPHFGPPLKWVILEDGTLFEDIDPTWQGVPKSEQHYYVRAYPHRPLP